MVRVETNCTRAASRVSTHCRLIDARCSPRSESAQCEARDAHRFHTARGAPTKARLIEPNSCGTTLAPVTPLGDRMPSRRASGFNGWGWRRALRTCWGQLQGRGAPQRARGAASRARARPAPLGIVSVHDVLPDLWRYGGLGRRGRGLWGPPDQERATPTKCAGLRRSRDRAQGFRATSLRTWQYRFVRRGPRRSLRAPR